jgi:hypothetical protein
MRRHHGHDQGAAMLPMVMPNWLNAVPSASLRGARYSR